MDLPETVSIHVNIAAVNLEIVAITIKNSDSNHKKNVTNKTPVPTRNRFSFASRFSIKLSVTVRRQHHLWIETKMLVSWAARMMTAEVPITDLLSGVLVWLVHMRPSLTVVRVVAKIWLQLASRK
jgi:hypothetical protein